MTTDTTLIQLPQDVSRRALSLARILDRLDPGKFTISLIKPAGKHERWVIEISQSVTIQRKELAEPSGVDDPKTPR